MGFEEHSQGDRRQPALRMKSAPSFRTSTLRGDGGLPIPHSWTLSVRVHPPLQQSRRAGDQLIARHRLEQQHDGIVRRLLSTRTRTPVSAKPVSSSTGSPGSRFLASWISVKPFIPGHGEVGHQQVRRVAHVQPREGVQAVGGLG